MCECVCMCFIILRIVTYKEFSNCVPRQHKLGDSDNFIPANHLVTPKLIQPELYFLFAYEILRSSPRNLYFTGFKKQYLTVFVPIYCTNIISVSYTHLDVYKRQTTLCCFK